MTEPGDYTQHDLDRYYGAEHLWKTFWSSFMDLCDRHVLNAGCGRAVSIAENLMWWGFDFNPDLVKLWQSIGATRCLVADARDLPFGDNEFEWTVSADFLEHVKPEDLETVSEELRRVAPHGRHIIDMARESSWRGEDGCTLHPSSSMDPAGWEYHFPGSTVREHEIRGHLILEW